MKNILSSALALALSISGLTATAAAQPSAETGSPVVQAPAPAQQPPVYAPQPYPAPYPAPYAAPPYGYPAPGYGYYPAPAPLRGRPARPIVGYRTVQRPTTALWGSGLALFLAGWVFDFAVLTPLANAISIDRPESVEQDSWAWSLVPLVGPWIQLGLEAPHPAIPVTMGLMQLGGVALIIAGLVSQQSVRVPIYQGDPEDPASDQVALSAQPAIGGGTLAVAFTHR